MRFAPGIRTIVAVAATLLGGGLVAAADYPPGSLVTASPTSGLKGYAVTVTATNCTPLEVLTYSLASSETIAKCAAPSGALGGGTAVVTITAPAAIGRYTGTVRGTVGFSGSFEIEVIGPPLPGSTPPLPVPGSTVPGSLPHTNGGGIGVSNSSPQPGGSFTVNVTNCVPGQVLTVTFAGSSQIVTMDAAGDGSIRLAAPTTPGVYEVRVNPCVNQTLSVRVPGRVGITGGGTPATPQSQTPATAAPATAIPATPATGASGTAEMMLMASGLFAVGLGLLGVAQIRRRQDELAVAVNGSMTHA